ncbi:type II toxin-antitoxin system PemK/MazF family toxin [Candidatus Acetothermia bacterium]|nr:type II toxin-antitoxin system PemK/MazF family toxin [Candidatus Acetothermia bacterium]MBI3660055.1 type II toxin-antitoxin system PemK/MazF family toxin [Candidatus Acetothermia bacterium]
MKRGELYRVAHPSARDPKKSRVFVVVSRQVLIDSRFSTVICAPVYSAHDGLSTQVLIGIDEGLKHDSSIHCDELVSLPKPVLTNFVGSLSPQKLDALNKALRSALDIAE